MELNRTTIPTRGEISTPLPEGFIAINAGAFVMGSVDADAGPFEAPEHLVFLSSFALKVTPVTNAEYLAFAKATGYITDAEQNGDALTWRDYSSTTRYQHPVVLLSWNDANAYCRWLASETNLAVNLPTEAQWEKAARGGLEGALYPWGNETAVGRACWERFDQEVGTLPVGQFDPNGFGLFDMAGLVWEWCMDYYADDYYADCVEQGETIDPCGPAAGSLRVRRGASWNIGESFRMRVSNRGCLPPATRWTNVGFRPAISLGL